MNDGKALPFLVGIGILMPLYAGSAIPSYDMIDNNQINGNHVTGANTQDNDIDVATVSIELPRLVPLCIFFVLGFLLSRYGKHCMSIFRPNLRSTTVRTNTNKPHFDKRVDDSNQESHEPIRQMRDGSGEEMVMLSVDQDNVDNNIGGNLTGGTGQKLIW